jgi:hypothetical protein
MSAALGSGHSEASPVNVGFLPTAVIVTLGMAPACAGANHSPHFRLAKAVQAIPHERLYVRRKHSGKVFGEAGKRFVAVP